MKKILITFVLILGLGSYAYLQSSKSSTNTTSTPATGSIFNDGSYTGSVADAFYGNLQVKATISGGKLTDITFLQYPSDRGTSIMINGQADPVLKSEAIASQSAQVDTVSGATDSSQAFEQSLGDALSQARA